MPKIPKGFFNKTFHNPNPRVDSNYYVVEDLSQTPCVTLALEALQSYPSQFDALLETISNMDSMILLENFNIFDVKLRLPYNVSFSIDVTDGGKNIG